MALLFSSIAEVSFLNQLLGLLNRSRMQGCSMVAKGREKGHLFAIECLHYDGPGDLAGNCQVICSYADSPNYAITSPAKSISPVLIPAKNKL